MQRGDIRTVGRELWSDGRGWILLGVAGGWFLSLGVRLIFPALLPYVRETFDFTIAVAGGLVTALWVAYALGQFPGGVAGDRLGEGNALVFSTVVSGVAIAAVAAATSPATLFFATVVFGFSTALFGPARFTILSAVYDRRDGTAIGLTLSAGEVGNAVLPVVAGIVAAATSWRFGIGFTVPLFFLMGVVLFWTVPGKLSEESAVDSLSVDTIRYLLGGIATWGVLITTGVHVFLFFVHQAFTGLYPTYLVEAKGLSPTAAAGFFGLFFTAGVGVQTLAGAGGDRFGTRPTLFVVTATTAVSLGVLPFVSGTVGLVAVTIAASSLLGVTPLTQTYLVNAMPEDMRGSGLGLLRTVLIGLGATGPVVIGSVADRGFFDFGILVLAGCAVCGLCLSVLIPGR
ncbi:MAG: MFS transporter [Natronomonas sp.]